MAFSLLLPFNIAQNYICSYQCLEKYLQIQFARGNMLFYYIGASMQLEWYNENARWISKEMN